VTNTGAIGALTLGALASSAGSVTINSTNAIGAVAVTTLGADGAVTVNVNGLLGTYTQTNTTAGSYVLNAGTYQGAAITGDTHTVDTAASITTNLAGTHIVTHSATGTILTVTLATGAGTDDLTVNHAALSNTVTVTGSLGTAAATDVLTIGGNTVFSTVNTSGVTGADGGFDFAMAAVGGSYTGGAGVDTITNGALITVASTISTGAGADVITITTANTATITVTGGTGLDTITTGATGAVDITYAAGDSGLTTATADAVLVFDTTADTLSMGTAGSAANFMFLDTTTSTTTDEIATVELAVNAANAAAGAGTSFDGTIKFMHVGDSAGGADGYLVADMDLDGVADLAIELTLMEVTADLVAADIVA
jgi:hypothetical protein